MAGNDNSSDLFMKFEVTTNNYIPGETRTDLTLSDTDLTKGFKPGSMFEVDSFTFKIGVVDNSDTSDTDLADTVKKMGQVVQKSVKQKIALPKSGSIGEYSKFRDGQPFNYPGDIQPVEIKRSMDTATIDLLQHCIWRTNFKSVSLIKRKAAGSSAAGEVFLRFDFDTVLITRVEWSDELPIQETCTFITRGVTINYLPQLPDGSLGAPIQRSWSMTPNAATSRG